MTTEPVTKILLFYTIPTVLWVVGCLVAITSAGRAGLILTIITGVCLAIVLIEGPKYVLPGVSRDDK